MAVDRRVVVQRTERRLAVRVVAHIVIACSQRKESANPKDVAEHKNCNHKEHNRDPAAIIRWLFIRSKHLPLMVVAAVPELVEIVHGAAKAHGLAVNDDRSNLEARDGSTISGYRSA